MSVPITENGKVRISKQFDVLEIALTPEPNDKMICASLNESFKHFYNIIRSSNTNRRSGNTIRYFQWTLFICSINSGLFMAYSVNN